MAFIGIDIGTSFIKGALLDPDTFNISEVTRVPFPQHLESHNSLFSEFDPDSILEVIVSLLQHLLAKTSECEGILFCSQMHGTVLVDEHGARRSSFISWTDHRGQMNHPIHACSFVDALHARVAPAAQRALGNELGLERPACVLFWMSEQQSLDRGLTPLSIADYAVATLCNTPPVTDITNAAATGLLNLRHMAWDSAVIRTLGLEALRFPEIVPHGTIVARYQRGIHAIPVYTPVGDVQSALLGALVDSSQLSINISTGAQVSRITRTLELGDHQTRPFFASNFINTFSDVPGGNSFDLLARLLLEPTLTGPAAARLDWASVDCTAIRTMDTGLEVNLPVNGRPGSILNMLPQNMTRGQVLCAALKGMARAYHTCASRLWPDRGWRSIVLSGGLALKSAAARECIRQQFGSEICLPPSAKIHFVAY